MQTMFKFAIKFNHPLASWDVSKVTTMDSMFRGATKFNQPLHSWDVSKVTKMAYMFSGATSFNQDLSAWDVTHAKEMTDMFKGASSFAQTLCGASWRLKDPKIVEGSKGSIGNADCTTTTIGALYEPFADRLKTCVTWLGCMHRFAWYREL